MLRVATPRPVVFVEIEPAQQLLDGASIYIDLLNMLNVTLPDSLKLTANALKIGGGKKRKFHLATIHFQVLC